MQHHFPGPGDDEDEEGLHRPVDSPAEEDTDETKAVRAGVGALVD